MIGKHVANHRGTSRKRIAALAVALTVLCSVLPARVYATGPDLHNGYLCGHVHDASCGYAEGNPGTPCTHEHDESCYTQVLSCPHICEHVCTHVCGAECEAQVLQCQHVCGNECFASVLSCQHVCGEECASGCVHVHDENCYTTINQCVHVHDEGCYVTAQQCVHTHDESCGALCSHEHDESCYATELSCQHVHDESCGYSEPVASAPCTHVCYILSFDGFVPGTPYSMFNGAGLSYYNICEALPHYLRGTLQCTGGSVDIPVKWACPDFAGEAGEYVFTAQPDNSHCAYVAADDPYTEYVNEGELPYILVTVPETVEEEVVSLSMLPESTGQETADTEIPAEETELEERAERDTAAAAQSSDEPAEEEVPKEDPAEEASTEGEISEEKPGEEDDAGGEIPEGDPVVEAADEADPTEQETAEGESEPQCTCTDRCTDESINADCPVCSADHTACEYVEQLELVLPLYELEERELEKTTDDGALIRVKGLLPVSAVLEAAVVPVENVSDFVEEGAVVLFAYDIKLMVPAAQSEAGTGEPLNEEGAAEEPLSEEATADAPLEGDAAAEEPVSGQTQINALPEMTEYQPSVPVTVSIIPPEDKSIDAPVEVTHVDAQNNAAPVNAETVDGAVEFEAEGFSVYIGTMGNGTEITLTPGSGYAFYSDADCLTEITNEEYYTALPATIYLKANNCTIESVVINNEGETDEDETESAATASENEEIWTLNFPDTLAQNQLITVTTTAHANGGTISSGSTPESVAALFDASVISAAETDNIKVTGSSGVFTVEVKNNILLKGTITVASGANVTLTTAGDYTIIRDVASCSNSMFEVAGTLSLGTGVGAGGTVTYHFTDESEQTLSPDDDIPEEDDARIAYVTVNRGYNNNMAGALTIDGGAVFTTPVNAASKTLPVCPTSTRCIVNSNGVLNLWAGVTLQNNNNNNSSDANTYAGIRIQSGNFFMYGGTIKQCSTTSGGSMSDGGGVCFVNGNAYFYGGEITQCCADNGAAVAIFGYGTHPSAYYLGTYIHANLAGGDGDYPGQACSAYAGAVVRMYDGDIINNRNTFTNSDADYDMKPSGSNSGIHLFGGHIGKLGVVTEATVNVYGCTIDSIQGDGTVTYLSGCIVTIPDCVALNAIEQVHIKAEKFNGSAYDNYIDIARTSTPTSRNMELDLLSGVYKITVDAPSMQKEYSVTVTTVNVEATPIARTMTTPAVLWQTDKYIELKTAGNDNPAVDGEIRYGYSTTNDSNTVTDWQVLPIFPTTGLTGNIYFFVKAYIPTQNPNNFAESISPALLVDFNLAISVQIDTLDIVAMSLGRNKTITIITTPVEYARDRVEWSISEPISPGTGVTRLANGNASLTVSATETLGTFTLKVQLLDHDNVPIPYAYDTITVALLPYAYLDYTSSEFPIALTAQLLNATGGPYTYEWQVSDADAVNFTTIVGQTDQTLQVIDYSYIGKQVRVKITDNGYTSTSDPVTILAPQLSVTVPTNITVSVNAAGTCTVTGGAITNNSAVPVYLTGVTYTWQTDGPEDADELFSGWASSKPTPSLTLAAGNTHNFTYIDNDAITWSGISANNSIAVGGTLAPTWGFNLNGSNIALAMAVNDSVTIANAVYTVGYVPT